MILDSAAVKKLSGYISGLVVVVGTAFAIDHRYALAGEVAKKADAADVYRLQRHLIEDKLEELRLRVFELSNKSDLTDVEKYQLEQTKIRIERKERELKG